ASSVGTMLFGALSDRCGARRTMIGGGLIFIAGTLLLSQIQSLWQLYFSFGVLLALGRAAAGVPLMALVTKWFVRNQGLALALAQSQNVGPAIFAPLSVFLLTGYGWRGAYLWVRVRAWLVFPEAVLHPDPSTRHV